ncbi:hypothetical protein RR48_14163 [Papilio machaon]|uniref:Uncharacterized protein n=1 Tax=Papilio machaon TaxID=76193 RepID=A0A194QM30_PAPMA|nr:hypothetical protein RR48_14163 [Papilio machaon]
MSSIEHGIHKITQQHKSGGTLAKAGAPVPSGRSATVHGSANRAPYPDEIDSAKTRAPPIVSISVRGRVALISLKLRSVAISAPTRCALLPPRAVATAERLAN